MPNTDLIVVCPKCGMQYEIPPEYLGQSAECSGCSFTFVLALPNEKKPAAPVKSDITTACTKCGARFEVAARFLGETAECPDCSALFVIADVGAAVKETPPPPETPSVPPPPSSPVPESSAATPPAESPSAVQPQVPPPQFMKNRAPEAERKTDVSELTVTEAEKDLTTNTVKISRKAFGMKPDFKDHFYNNLPKAPPEPERPARQKPSPPPPPVAAPPPVPPAPARKPAKVWWKFWTWFG